MISKPNAALESLDLAYSYGTDAHIIKSKDYFMLEAKINQTKDVTTRRGAVR